MALWTPKRSKDVWPRDDEQEEEDEPLEGPVTDTSEWTVSVQFTKDYREWHVTGKAEAEGLVWELRASKYDRYHERQSTTNADRRLFYNKEQIVWIALEPKPS